MSFDSTADIHYEVREQFASKVSPEMRRMQECLLLLVGMSACGMEDGSQEGLQRTAKDVREGR